MKDQKCVNLSFRYWKSDNVPGTMTLQTREHVHPKVDYFNCGLVSCEFLKLT